MVKYVNCDLKHWGGRRARDGPFRCNYRNLVRQAHQALGDGGIVAIVNARPNEFRFEEFFEKAKEASNPMHKGDERIFFDPQGNITFIKSQEVEIEFSGETPELAGQKLVFLAYGMAPGTNLDDTPNSGKSAEEVLKQTSNKNYLLGLTAPSCIETFQNLVNERPDLLGYFDFVITYAGTSAVADIPIIGEKMYGQKNVNKLAERTYIEKIAIEKFEHPLKKTMHKIGTVAVSGGHRAPSKLISKIIPASVGTNYINIPKPNNSSQYDFMKDLKENVRELISPGLAQRNPVILETLLRHILSIKLLG